MNDKDKDLIWEAYAKKPHDNTIPGPEQSCHEDEYFCEKDKKCKKKPVKEESKKEDISGPHGKPDGKVDEHDWKEKRNRAIKKAKGEDHDDGEDDEDVKEESSHMYEDGPNTKYMEISLEGLGSGLEVRLMTADDFEEAVESLQPAKGLSIPSLELYQAEEALYMKVTCSEDFMNAEPDSVEGEGEYDAPDYVNKMYQKFGLDSD